MATSTEILALRGVRAIMLDYDVLIAGYGPTGAVAANLLGLKGVRVLVVEPSLEIFDIPRAVHFDGEVMRVFQALGLADNIAQVSAPGDAIGFTNGENWKLLQQDLTEYPRHHGWANSNFFNQPALEANLREGVQRFSCVDVSLGERVTEVRQTVEGVEVGLAGVDSARQVSAAYLLACDGASSTVRELTKIDQEDLECDEPWLVCDWMLPTDFQINRQVYQICDPNRPTSLVPCEGGHIRWEFMVNTGESAEILQDETFVRSLMAPHVHRLSNELDANMGELIRAKVYTFHALIAKTFQTDRVFLLGDAAHQMPPFLGQGMCAGVRDAHNLSWKIAGVLSGEYTREALKTYTSERQPHVREVIKTAVGHGSIIQNRSKLLCFARDCFLKLGAVFPPLISFLRFDLSWPLGTGLFGSASDGVKDTPVGNPFPQFGFSDAGLGDAFCLVTVAEEIGKADLPADLDITGKTIDELTTDQEGRAKLKHWFTEHSASAVLVRPDRYVFGYSTSPDGVEKLVSDLQRSLRTDR